MLLAPPSFDVSAAGGDTMTVHGWAPWPITAPTHAWLAVAVAAVGGHHLTLTGSRGTHGYGLALAVGRLLPDLLLTEASAANEIRPQRPGRQPSTARRRPPVEQITPWTVYPDVIGWNDTPGAVSLAHLGVLILRQPGRFSSDIVSGLEQAMTDGHVTTLRNGRRLPARFQAVLDDARCGCPARHGPHDPVRCVDRAAFVDNLTTLNRFIDLRVDLDDMARCATYGITDPTDLSDMVRAASWRARVRLRHLGVRRTADLRTSQLNHARWDTPALSRLRRRLRHKRITVEQYTAITRIAMTLSDLATRPGPDHTDVRTAALLHGVAF